MGAREIVGHVNPRPNMGSQVTPGVIESTTKCGSITHPQKRVDKGFSIDKYLQ